MLYFNSNLGATLRCKVTERVARLPASIVLSAVFLLQDGRVAYTVPDKSISRLQK